MEAHHTRARWTYAEFARLPSEGGARNEIIDGELFVTPAPATRHQQIVTELVIVLGRFVKEHALGRVLAGPIDVLFAEGAEGARVLGTEELLRWTPVEGGETLEVAVDGIFARLD